jgi:HK97 family phage prohead protease
MPKNASQYPMNGVTLGEVKDRIAAACKKFGIDVSNDSGRAAGPAEIVRWYALEDMHIMSRGEGDGSGRVVEAFAAVFGQPAEIKDFEGHYVETIDRTAFNKRLADLERSKGGFASVKVLYNHGMTLQGTPSERFSMPVGVPLRDGGIIATERGLLTRTEYNRTPLAEEVLELIRSGSVTSQSFTGRIVRSDPQLGRGQQHRPRNGELPQVRRTELGLREYSSVVWPAYEGAEIFGVRMSTPGAAAQEPDEEEALPPDGEAAAGEPPALPESDEHSARYHQHALYRLRSRELRERIGLDW